MPGSYSSTRWCKRLRLTLDHCEIVWSQISCGIHINFYNSITLYYTLEHMYDNIMDCSILRLIVYPSPLCLEMDKDCHQGLEVNTAVKTMLGMKNKCCVNVKVHFEILCVCVQVSCGIQANFYNFVTLYYTLEHIYDNIMVCSILRLIIYPSPLHVLING